MILHIATLLLMVYVYHANGDLPGVVHKVYLRIFNGMSSSMQNVKIVGEVQSLVSILHQCILHKVSNILKTNISVPHSLIAVVFQMHGTSISYLTFG